MKRFLIFILTFFTFSVAFNNIFYYIINEFLVSKSNFRYSRILNENPDLIIMGNSRGVHSISEHYWDTNYDSDILNLSYNNMSPESIILFINDLNKRKQARFGIEISSFYTWEEDKQKKDITDKYLISDNFRSYRYYFASLDQYFNNKDNLFHSIFKLFNFNNDLFSRIIFYLKGNDKEWLNFRQISADQIKEVQNIEKIKLTLHKEQFDKLLDVIKNNNADVFFYESLWFEDYKNKIDNYLDIQNLIQNYSLEYYDLNDKFRYYDEYFSDFVHTNKDGAEVQTQLLFKLLNKE